MEESKTKEQLDTNEYQKPRMHARPPLLNYVFDSAVEATAPLTTQRHSSLFKCHVEAGWRVSRRRHQILTQQALVFIFSLAKVNIDLSDFTMTLAGQKKKKKHTQLSVRLQRAT